MANFTVSDTYSISEYDYEDFIYSINLRSEVSEAKEFHFAFGVNETKDKFWELTFDFENDQIVLGNQDLKVIKSVDHVFLNDKDYMAEVIVNDSTVKVYVDNTDVVLLAFGLEEYDGGRYATNKEVSMFTTSQESLTSLSTVEGDIFCSGYTVNKVVNLSDGNYCLTSQQYTISKGVLTIKDEYLNTLEKNTQYKFRAVTSLTDFDFYVTTEKVGAELYSSIAKYYRGSNLRFELSETTVVSKFLIDNKECAFTQDGKKIVVNASETESITSGEHVAKAFTTNGRPEAKFVLTETVEVLPEIPTPVSHVFFFIDIAIFAVLIVGYVVISQIKNHSKQEGNHLWMKKLLS